jgi:hypothetical protein
VFQWGDAATVTSTNIFTQIGISSIIISAVALSLRSKRDNEDTYESLFESEYNKFKGSIS